MNRDAWLREAWRLLGASQDSLSHWTLCQPVKAFSSHSAVHCKTRWSLWTGQRQRITMNVANQYSLVYFKEKWTERSSCSIYHILKICLFGIWLYVLTCVGIGALHDYGIMQVIYENQYIFPFSCQKLQRWGEWYSCRDIQRRKIIMQRLHSTIKKHHPSSPSSLTASAPHNTL